MTPVQFVALAKTETQPGIDQAALARLIAYDRTTIGGAVDRLVQKGPIERKISSRDTRALHPTERGREVLRRLEPTGAEAQRKIVAGLEPDEAKIFLRLLQKVISAPNEQSRAPLGAESTATA